MVGVRLALVVGHLGGPLGIGYIVVIFPAGGPVNYRLLHLMTKSLPVSFRLPQEVKEALERAAKEDTRSVSSLMEKLITDWLREKGYLPK